MSPAEDRRTSALNDEILAAVNAVESQDSRIVLTLLARVHADILTRLDAIHRDEQRIKNIALNGLTDTHHDDHAWLARHRPALEASISFSAERAELGGYCDFAARKIAEEKENATSKRRISEALIVDGAKAVAMFVLGAVAAYVGLHV